MRNPKLFEAVGGTVNAYVTDLTLRDLFAAATLQGFASTDLSFGTQGRPDSPWEWVAEQSYKAADAMLAEREKGEP